MLMGIVGAAVAAQLKIANLQAQLSEMDALKETVELQEMQLSEMGALKEEVALKDAEIAELSTVAKEARKQTKKQAKHVECGMCGANVSEWWYVRDDADTEFVEVCRYCYECVLEDGR